MKRHALHLALLACIGLVACHTTRQAAPAAAADTEADATQERETRQRAEQKMLAPPPAPAAPAGMLAWQDRGTTLDAITVPGTRMVASEIANTENYAQRDDNPVQRASEHPVSTFSIDVDTSSYSNVLRMLNDGIRPPPDAVRAEEFVNYFDYGHPGPASRETPFKVSTELAPAPWNAKRQLLMIGIKGYDVPRATLPPANLVLLIDTSVFDARRGQAAAAQTRVRDAGKAIAATGPGVDRGLRRLSRTGACADPG